LRKFSFPLARVLDWRRTQVRMEEARLERLYAELHGLEARAEQTRTEKIASEKALVESRSVTGEELAALDAFKKAAASERERLERLAADCRARIAQQIEAVSQKRRDARLLENVEQRRRTAWRADLAREIDQQAEELHLAKWAAGHGEDQGEEQDGDQGGNQGGGQG
jgi:hypothetical protein